MSKVSCKRVLITGCVQWEIFEAFRYNILFTEYLTGSIHVLFSQTDAARIYMYLVFIFTVS